MKLKGISDKGLRRIAQEGPLFGEEHMQDEQNEVHDAVYDALEILRGVSDMTLSPLGVDLVNQAYEALWEFQQNMDKVLK